MLQGFRGEKGREGPPGPDGKPVSASSSLSLFSPLCTVVTSFKEACCLHVRDSAYVVCGPRGKMGNLENPALLDYRG